MTPDKAAVRTYFAKLGLETEIADIYLALHASGPQTISELSRSSGVERTRIYRLIDQLIESGLIEVETHYKRGVLKAAPIANLRILISRREQELQGLQDELQMVEQLLGRNQLASPASRIQFYHSQEGAKQMLWNETRAKGEIVGVLYQPVQIDTGSKFFERWVSQCNQKDLRFRSVYGDKFQHAVADWYTTHDNERLKHWQGRLINAETLSISHSMFVYDDVVAYYNWKEGEIFGIEIHNKDIAASQRGLFELLWDKAAAELTQ